MAHSLKKITPDTNLQNRDVAIDSGHWHPIEQMRRQFEHLFQDLTNMPSIFSRQQRFDADPFGLPYSPVAAECAKRLFYRRQRLA